MTYLVGLLAIVGLCVGWGLFQLWLAQHDPDAQQRLNKCGNCGCAGSESCKRAHT